MEENLPQKPPGQTLRQLREQAGLTRPQVKQLIGVSERTQADWESGKSTPSLENAVALCRLYSISLKKVCDFFGMDLQGVPDDVHSEALMKAPVINPSQWNIPKLSEATGIPSDRLEQLRDKHALPTGEDLIRLGQALRLPVIPLASYWSNG